MKKSLSYNPNKTMYDGDEEGFYNFNATVSLPKNGGEVIYDNVSATPIWNASEDIRNNIVNNIKGIKKIEFEHDQSPSYKYGGLDIYFNSIKFDGTVVILVVAAGEVQPTRFIIKMLGAIYQD